MADFDSSKIGMIIGGSTLLGSVGAGSLFGYLSSDTVSEQLTSGIGVDQWADNTSEFNGNTSEMANGHPEALSTVWGLLTAGAGIGGSSYSGGNIIEIFTQNKKPYSQVERKAKQIYDKYNKNHTVGLDEGASLIVVDPETAKVINEIVAGAKSKEELLKYLDVLEKVIQEASAEEIIDAPVEKMKEYGKND